MRPSEPLKQEEVLSADKALFVAHAALRRWEALPPLPGYSEAMRRELAQFRHKYVLTRGSFLGELSKRFKAWSRASRELI